MCFIHVLLNALDMHKHGIDVKLVIEGSATALLEEMNFEDHPLFQLYQEVKEKKLIHCVCTACANKMETLKSSKEQNLPLCGPMKGHPSMAEYMAHGYEILIF